MKIRIETLSKHYGPQKAVDNLSFEVKREKPTVFLYETVSERARPSLEELLVIFNYFI